VFNPKAYAQIGGTQNVTIALEVFELSFLVDVVLYRFTVLDFLARIDTIDWKEMCYGAKWQSKTIDISLRTDIHQKECIAGVLGLFLAGADVVDCEWVEYPLMKQWFNIPLMKDYNRDGVWQDYTCSIPIDTIPEEEDPL